MRCRELTEIEQERYELAADRLREIAREDAEGGAAARFFAHEAAFLTEMDRLRERLWPSDAGTDPGRTFRPSGTGMDPGQTFRVSDAGTDPGQTFRVSDAGTDPERTLEVLMAQNRALYEEILPEHYETCYGNPAYAERLFGENGPAIGFLYMELRGAVICAYENRKWDLLILMELLLSIYSSFAQAREEAEGEPEPVREEASEGEPEPVREEASEGEPESVREEPSEGEPESVREEPEGRPEPEALRQVFYWYVYDYCRDFMQDRIYETLHPDASIALDIIREEDLTDPRYLFRFGEYITENEIRTAEFLASMPQEEIDAIARTWTEGYRIGFEVTGKDLSIKKTVNIRWRLGFERVVLAAVKQFEEMGLESILYRSASHIVSKHANIRVGYYGAIPNPQFEYDHRNDSALYLDDRFVTHRLQVLQQAYEAEKEAAGVHGGPAVMDVFGEMPFMPENNPSALIMTPAQQKLEARYRTESGQIVNRYIKGEERSFTIIAYPVPDIGPKFEQIFYETVRINNLDYNMYRDVQQKLIDALDEGTEVRVRGMNGNETDLTIHLHTLENPSSQTNFENCVADVNIPVGEVFTSPLLAGTNGLLHVKQVYLNELQYRDLRIRLQDGMISDYSCANYEDPAAGRKLMEENILFHHETVPIGEFAIGTNTTAYQVSHTYGIADKLPILIAEKMGPHFAFGDTCYSFQEDTAVYNPDGKEIIARDNERSLLRKTAPEQAYFGCHTDITIPYEELGAVTVVRQDGSEIRLLENGRFVLPGTEVLNEPLDELKKVWYNEM